MTGKEWVLDDFEHNNIHIYELNRNFVKTYDIAISNEKAKFGNKSLMLHYHFGGWSTGNGAMHIIFKEDLIAAKERPLKLGVWVYGDGKSPWLRATFLDGLGDRKTVNLTEGNIDWIGWKYIDAVIDPTWKMPLKLEMIYAVEVNKTYQGDPNYSGVIYFDQLRFVYVDDIDLKGPVFSDVKPQRVTVYSDTFTFSAKVMDDMSGVNPESINVQLNGGEIAHHFCQESHIIKCYFKHVREGTSHISVQAEDNAGNLSNPGIEKTITVDLSPDVEKPQISNITPTETAVEYTDTPRITFHLFDCKSGVNQKEINVRLNDNKLDVVYDEQTGWGYALPDKKLTSGLHTFTITAADRAGNKLHPIKKQFRISTLEQPDNPEKFSLTIIPDTHSITYSQLALRFAGMDPSDLVLHMGDMVDQGTKDEFKAFIKSRDNLMQQKSLLTIPGNHESFPGNLDAYMDHFGSPTYHFEYGNMLFIALNSANDQSILASDSTQFDYVKRLLKSNTKNNVLIVTHVPTRDDFGTAHGMSKDDAMELEQILGNYKERHKNINVTVLFGHMHMLHQWEHSGVNYIITGNSAAKRYVGDDQKSLLGYGVLTVSKKDVIYKYKPFLTGIKILYKNDDRSKLQMKFGTHKKLDVQGKCHVLNPDETVDLTNIDFVKKQWFTSNKDVAKINQRGIIEACGKGEAIITADVYGLQSMIKIVVV